MFTVICICKWVVVCGGSRLPRTMKGARDSEAKNIDTPWSRAEISRPLLYMYVKIKIRIICRIY